MFVPNNAQFRILSSLCLSKYKEAQAAALNEVQSNLMYKFHNMTKSALLLQYDLWFGWLIHVDRSLVRKSKDELLSRDTSNSLLVAAETLETHRYEHIIKRENKIFSNDFLEGHFAVRKFSFDAFRVNIRKSSGQKVGDAMYSLTRSVMTMLENSLYELQELDFILFGDKSEKAFLSIQDWDMDLLRTTNNCVVLRRGKLFSEVYGVSEFNLKSYTSDQTPNIGLLLKKLEDLEISVINVI